MTGRHLVPRVWGPGVRPTQIPLLKGSPSRRRKARGGRPDGHARARTTIRDPPQCGAWVLPQPEPVAAAPGRGGSAGAKGACAASAWRTRGCVRWAVWLGRATQGVGGAAWWGAPSGAGVARAPLVWQTTGGAERRRVRRPGAPDSVQGPITVRQLGATEGGTGRPHNTSRHHTPPRVSDTVPPHPFP